ncbi:hypothetical protein FW774_01110 (plasmid) [Pedobacter sp. BS3]|uniref:hypothetical protein n=1 Tax=Pedobacter sp. BS3 TaxID=2567937 RepID=UPI0011ED6F7A|nr:hypothetical protein [Pedobacter sp. BS3]TZF85706.1 hypothetical protein FW774_01110 [Pedobacter sp. BS3]
MKRIPLLTLALAVLLAAGIGACKKNKKDDDSSSCGTVCNKPLDNGQTAGTTPSGIVGKYKLTYHKVNNGGPFADGEQVNFELTSDNKLKVSTASDCVTIENPRATSPVEVSFPDNCKFNVSFAASASTQGGLNEVNVGSLTGQFYGQFRK